MIMPRWKLLLLKYGMLWACIILAVFVVYGSLESVELSANCAHVVATWSNALFPVAGGLLLLLILRLTIIPVLAIPFNKWIKSSRNVQEIPFVMITCLVVTISVGTASFYEVKRSSRHTLKRLLRSFSDTSSVYIDNCPVEDAISIIETLSRVRPIAAHHSHPAKAIPIMIETESSKLELEIHRDSMKPNEYWVYYAPFSCMEPFHVGGVITDMFDDY